MSAEGINKSINIPVVSSNNKYVSVVIPSDSDCPVNGDELVKPSIKDLVFESQKEALPLLKKYKNSRFKVFNNYDDAFNFSLEYSFKEDKSFMVSNEDEESFYSPYVPKFESFSDQFKAPANTSLATFRKLIQSDEIKKIEDLLENPRYLISSSENPVLLMEGPRYNAFHIACKANKFNVLKLIMDKLKDEHYMTTLFYLDDSEAIQRRIEHIVDLYLNTPDKGLHDTPLHLSCKFGCYECVKILLNEPQCNREMKNKNDLTAFDVICDRNNNNELKEKIQKLFFCNYYVPISRDEETTIIGEPEQSLKTPKSSSISAIAGPMPKNLAVDLYERLKNPRSRSKEEVAIRLSDHSKGIERIARVQCRQNSIDWKEYWPFLNELIDLTSDEGLRKLENHFSQLNERKKSTKRKDESDSLDGLISNFEKFTIDDEGDQYWTAPSTPDEEYKYFEYPVIDEEDEEEDVIYVDGGTISDLDIDAALALQDTPIDAFDYPRISKWLDAVSNYIRENKKLKVAVALCIPNHNLSSLSFNSTGGDVSINDSFMFKNRVPLKDITSPYKLIAL